MCAALLSGMFVRGEEIQARLELACRAAREAGGMTLRLFNDRSFSVDVKADGSPVTAADRSAEEFLRRAIAGDFPDDAICGEEFGDAPGTSGFRWLIDPIDGTASFVRGVPLFGTMVGIELDAMPVAGVIEMPAMRERVFGSVAAGAWHQVGDAVVRRAHVSGAGRLNDAMLCTTSLDSFVKAGREGLYSRLQAAAGSTRGWSDCYAFVLLATGRIEAVIEPVVRPWDVTPAAAVILAAGGRVTDLSGKQVAEWSDCVASNAKIHDELVAITRRA